jgi:GAG-pre-integrase domain
MAPSPRATKATRATLSRDYFYPRWFVYAVWILSQSRLGPYCLPPEFCQAYNTTIDMNHLIKPNINTARTAIMNLTINYNKIKNQEITLELAHRRLGHILMPQVKRLLNDKLLDMTFSSQDMYTCDNCKRG